MKTLFNRRIVILAADGYERDSLNLPREALLMAGATTDLMSLTTKSVQAAGTPLDALLMHEISLQRVQFCDGLLIPDGASVAKALIGHPPATAAITHLARRGRPIAVIGTASLVLSHLGLLDGLMVSSPDSLRSELLEGGAIWMNAPYAIDDRIISARSGRELSNFNNALIETIARVVTTSIVASAR